MIIRAGGGGGADTHFKWILHHASEIFQNKSSLLIKFIMIYDGKYKWIFRDVYF